MTSKLYEMLVREYPSEKGDARSRISIYGADERIYLSLFNRIFSGKDNLMSAEGIEGIARRFFNLFYAMREINKGELTIVLNPEGDMDKREYDGHLIIVHSHFLFPEMEIWTGNRGKTVLEEEQRGKYFGFVKEVYEKFLENAKKNKA
jgi:hypothetical protein